MKREPHRQRCWVFARGPGIFGTDNLLTIGIRFRGIWYRVRFVRDEY